MDPIIISSSSSSSSMVACRAAACVVGGATWTIGGLCVNIHYRTVWCVPEGQRWWRHQTEAHAHAHIGINRAYGGRVVVADSREVVVVGVVAQAALAVLMLS